VDTTVEKEKFRGRSPPSTECVTGLQKLKVCKHASILKSLKPDSFPKESRMAQQ